MAETLQMLRRRFAELFGGEPLFFRAPGRVNLIGEHTDYNDGLVMPAAIGFYMYAAIAPRRDGRLQVHSTSFSQTVSFEPQALEAAGGGDSAGPSPHWSEYVRGVTRVLRENGLVFSGADLLLHGQVPLGSGLSSSAALELAVGLALCEMTGMQVGRPRLAAMCQEAENRFVGTRCGIMDQFASACGREGYALLLDCRSLEYSLLPLGGGLRDAQGQRTQLVVCNTMVRHRLAGGEYNRRREQCEAAVRALAQQFPAVRSLREVSLAMLEQAGSRLDPLLLRRSRHVVSENLRVESAARALQRADLAGFGALMAESHRSLREDYEVSCDELDLMVQLAGAVEGVLGARMTGGGFGGCTVNLVRADAVPAFCSEVAAGYARATGHRPEIHVCAAADGAAALDLGEETRQR